MRVFVAIAVASLAACVPAAVDYEGKSCTPSTGCFGPLACDPFTWTCESDAGWCPYAFAPPLCSSSPQDFFLAPNGSDANPGTDANSPRLTLSNVRVRAGDSIHFATGSYPLDLGLVTLGTSSCPITLEGPADGSAVVTRTMDARSYWWIRSLSFQVSPPNQFAITTGNGGQAVGVRIEGCHFKDLDTDAGAPLLADVYADVATDFTMVGCDFVSAHTAVTAGGSANLLLQGNSFALNAAAPVAAVDLDAVDTLLDGNDFSGSTRYDGFIALRDSAVTGRLVRNVIHDVSQTGRGNVVFGAKDVTSNTFLRLGLNATAADSRTFADNVVAFAGGGWAQPDPSGGGAFNLFFNVQSPYTNGGAGQTDVSGDPQPDPTSFVPSAGSPAIDAADPTLPVPSGGGARADIGARERGATLQAEGTYCLPPP